MFSEETKLFFTLLICFVVVAYTNSLGAAMTLAVVWMLLLLSGV